MKLTEIHTDERYGYNWILDDLWLIQSTPSTIYFDDIFLHKGGRFGGGTVARIHHYHGEYSRETAVRAAVKLFRRANLKKGKVYATSL